MSFVPYVELKCIGVGPKSLLSSQLSQIQAAIQHQQTQSQSTVGNGNGSGTNKNAPIGVPSLNGVIDPDASIPTSRPNILRQLTGGLQAVWTRIQIKAQEQKLKHNGTQRAATSPQPQDFTRPDGFLKISTSLPLLN